MNINLTPTIQSQIYMDKKDSYLLNMVEKLTPKIEYEPKAHKEQDDLAISDKKEHQPILKESDLTFHSIVQANSLNNSIGSTQNFFNTLASAGGTVSNLSNES